jgi:chromosome segregation ATPase
LEKEWEKANAELLQVVQDRALLEAKVDKQTEQLELLENEQAFIDERHRSQPPEYDQMLEKLELVSANNDDLKTRLQQAERETQEYLEQWLWTKASLDTTCSELDVLRESVGQSDEKIRQMQEKIAEQEAKVENWKNSVGRMTNLLYEAEEKAKTLEKAFEEVKEKAADSEEKNILQGQVRMQQAQIEAYEAEVNHIQDEIERQSQNLAEMRATLIEREISLNQTKETADRQGAELEHIKRMASKRIRSLEAELAETKHKLKDLSVWLERRNRREEGSS